MAVEELAILSLVAGLLVAVLIALLRRPLPAAPAAPPAPQPGVFGIRVLTDQAEVYYGKERVSVRVELTEGSRPNFPVRFRIFVNGRVVDESPLMFDTVYERYVAAEAFVEGDNTVAADCVDATNVVATASAVVRGVAYPGLKITSARLIQVGPRTYRWECEWTPTKPPYWVSVVFLGPEHSDWLIVANLEEVMTSTFSVTASPNFDVVSGYMTVLDNWDAASIVGVRPEA